MIRIVQLTDCHVSASPAAMYRGINPRHNLERLLGPVSELSPDLLLATGDLAEDGSREAYEYLARKLASVAAPLVTVPGNHDDFGLQKALFPQTPTDVPLLTSLGHWQIIAMNSAAAGRIDGVLDEKMLNGLDRLLEDRRQFKLLVLHHQPVATGSRWIDRYALNEPEKLWGRIDGREDIRAIAWGHIHHEITAVRAGIRLLGTPSTAANSMAHAERFSFDPAGPACRLIELGPDGQLETRLIRP